MIKKTTAFLTFLLTFFSLCAQNQPFEWTWEKDGPSLSIILNAPPHSYVYKNMTSVELKQGTKLLKPAKIPRAISKNDPVMGNTSVYEGKNTWTFLVQKKDDPLTLSLSWQGCGIEKTGSAPVCYLPLNVEKKIEANITSHGILFGKKTEKALDIPKKSKEFRVERTAYGYLNSNDFIAFLKGEHSNLSFAGKSIIIVILLSLLGGIALNLTPCVLPMIPINLAIIGADTGDKRKSILRGFIYAAGIAIAYGTVGLAVVLGGATFGALDSFWYFNLGVSIVFILLGLSMFDVFSIDLSRYSSNLKTPSAARLTGVFFLGAISALLAGACVAPVVIAVLIHSASLYASGNLFGLFLPFFLGLGMGLPWPIIAAGIAGAPKPGKWMVKVKYAFGILIVLIGFYYGWIGTRLLIADRTTASKSADFHSTETIQKALSESKKDGRPVLIDFWADWCKNCKAMDLSTLKDPKVKEALKQFHFIKFDATNVSDPKIKKEMDRFNVSGLPTYVIVKPE